MISQRTVLAVYVFLLVTIGFGAAVLATTGAIPGPGDPDIQKMVATPEIAKLYSDELPFIRERQRRLGEVAVSGFATVLGALIGFLSAVSVGRRNVDSTQ